jgi:small subunit ribosomal protein S7
MVNFLSNKNSVIDSSIIFEKLVQFMIISGGKKKARMILQQSLSKASMNLDQSENNLLLKAIMNVSPDIEVKSKKIRTTNYLVPKPLSQERKLKVGIKLFLESVKSRKEYGITTCLTNELIDAYNNKGTAVKRKEDIHKQAEANKSFSHFNW